MKKNYHQMLTDFYKNFLVFVNNRFDRRHTEKSARGSFSIDIIFHTNIKIISYWSISYGHEINK